MSLDDLETDVELAYEDLDDYEFLDRESRQELAMLSAALDADTDELLRRAIHLLFQSTTESGRLDFHLRSTYDVTYDEYLSGMTFDDVTGGAAVQQPDDDRRYQF
ncbi:MULTISPECIES: hypothetical protein [unclassified Halobacterium]|uniref:hypothetical protein n=1 Tax=unclassified Halobacterium TaxID=2668073 RepID=UPI001E43AC12|nr:MULTISPECIES: hypothetical protein [unclassified Halobacterium]MCD2199695.1 hypothetical protein [Halobacterium sp. KA-4]MCD2203619.1 hypothetical protein [Halobacterium sp. KA-6]